MQSVLGQIVEVFLIRIHKESEKMKEIGTVTIGKLIVAHYEKDEVKFKAYAEHIADALKEQGDERGERIIRSRINGTYKNNPKAIILDNGRENA